MSFSSFFFQFCTIEVVMGFDACEITVSVPPCWEGVEYSCLHRGGTDTFSYVLAALGLHTCM